MLAAYTAPIHAYNGADRARRGNATDLTLAAQMHMQRLCTSWLVQVQSGDSTGTSPVSVTQLCHLGIQFEHQSLTRCEARSSGQYTVDKKSSSVCPTAGVQQRLHGRATSVQYSKNKMSETDVAQGQSAMPHILRCFDNGCPKKVVNPNGPGRNWPRQCIMEIPKFLNSCNFMPWHPALT